LQIWNTAGQERFRTITTAYYRGAMGIMFIYDVADHESFASVRNWIHSSEQHAHASVNKMIIAHTGFRRDQDDLPSDLHPAPVVSRLEGQALADEYTALFAEVDTGKLESVTEAFTALARIIRNRLRDGDAYNEKNVAIAKERDKKLHTLELRVKHHSLTIATELCTQHMPAVLALIVCSYVGTDLLTPDFRPDADSGSPYLSDRKATAAAQELAGNKCAIQ
jgi:hypothetical protein